MGADSYGQENYGGGITSLVTETAPGLMSPETLALINSLLATGLQSGGSLTRLGGLVVRVVAGVCYSTGTKLVFAQTDLTLPANSTRYIFVDTDGIVKADASAPNIFLQNQLGVAVTDGASVTVLIEHTTELANIRPRLHDYTDDAVGSLTVSGCQITPHAGVNLQIVQNSGEYYLSYDNKRTVDAQTPIASLTRWYRDGSGGWTAVPGQTALDDAKYDDGTGTLATLTAGKYKADLVYITETAGGGTEVHVFYGQVQYDTELAAQVGEIINVEPQISDKGLRCGAVVILESSGDIASVVDLRPFAGTSASLGTAVTVHNDLTGRDSAVAHGQYLLRDGSDAGITGDVAVAALKKIDGRDLSVDGAAMDAHIAAAGNYLLRDGSDAGMSDDLDMNSNDIVAPGLVDGRDVSTDGATLDAAAALLLAHAARHAPGGGDALQVTTDHLLGRDTAATGDVEFIAVTAGLEFTGAGGIQRSALTGDVTAPAGSNATTIANDAVTTGKILNDAVTFAKIQNLTTDRLVGRDTAATGDAEEISVGGGLEFTGGPGIQRSALTGDVTATAGSNATTIAADAVTFAKMQNIATDRLLGRDTAATGDVEEISVGGGLEFSGAAAIQRSALTGDVTATAGSNATTIAANAVTDAKFRQSAGLSVVGRSVATTGNVADITAATAGHALTNDGTTVAFRAVDTLGEDLNLTGVLTPATLAAGDNNDYNPTNLATSTILRLTPHAQGSALTGLAGGASGRVAIIKNVATYELLRLKNENASSSAANRFSNGFDILVQPGETVIAGYDGTLSRWVVINPFANRDPVQRTESILEDFHLGSAESGEIGRYGWTFTTFGIVGVNAVQNHPGIVQTQSSATIGAVNRLKLANADTGTMFRHDEWREMTWIFAPATATFDLDFRMGLMSDASANPPGEGVFIEKLAADTNYQLVTRASAAQTRLGSGQAAANGTYIKITARKNGTNIDWFVNDVYVTQSTANLTAAATGLLPVHQQIPTATNARSWNIDLFHLHFQNMTR